MAKLMCDRCGKKEAVHPFAWVEREGIDVPTAGWCGSCESEISREDAEGVAAGKVGYDNSANTR